MGNGPRFVEEKARRKTLEKMKLPEPRPYERTEHKLPLATGDSETDPFMRGREPRPFTFGFYDGHIYADFWGEDCAQQFVDFLSKTDPHVIYFHNGGGFDFFFLLPYCDDKQTIKIMHGRIVAMLVKGHELRDSLRIIPEALDRYQKTKIEYGFFEIFPCTSIRTKKETTPRALYEKEIREYQRSDCVFLFDLIEGFATEFGDKLTIGSASLPMLNSFHGFEKLDEATDEMFRPYYMGGRVEAFEIGVMEDGPFYVYDVNSMYPSVMREFSHPVGDDFTVTKNISERTHFARIEATSEGVLPLRGKFGIDFPHGRHEFYATGHEIRAGLETGALTIHKTFEAYRFRQETKFTEFVETFYQKRKDADAAGDMVRKMLFKYVLNSAYGKFGQNPRDYEEHILLYNEAPTQEVCSPENATKCRKETCKERRALNPETGCERFWLPVIERNGWIIWSRPSQNRFGGFKNVATAASITGAARAQLYRGIQSSGGLVYCDTDSLICREFSGEVDPTTLGKWKAEGSGEHFAVAGKKLYALFENGICTKKAHKGIKATGNQIARIAQGETVEFPSPVPKFKLDGKTMWISRKIKRKQT